MHRQAIVVKENFGRFLVPLIVNNTTFQHLKKFLVLFDKLEAKGVTVPKIVTVLKELEQHSLDASENYRIADKHKERVAITSALH